MARYYARKEIIKRLHRQTGKGKSFLVFGAGNGLSAKSAESGGADIIAIYSTAAIRMKGLPSLMCACPYGDANEDMFHAAEGILPLVEDTPCIAGVGAHNPLEPVERLLERVQRLGFSGVMNEPFVGIYGPWFAALCEESGIGFSCEVELIRTAHDMGLFTLAWVFDAEETRVMTRAGADVIGAMVMDGPKSLEHPGYTEEERLQDAVEKVDEMCKAAKEVRGDVLVLTHGDPFYDEETVRQSIQQTGAVGYACGSSGERTPARQAVILQTGRFRGIPIEAPEKTNQEKGGT